MASIIDSHIHLWPAETCNEEAHTWMTPGMPLVKPHLLKDYQNASNGHVRGAVYVETDVRYFPPDHGDVTVWAKGPLDEIAFLRGLIEQEHIEPNRPILLGLVPWAPVDQPADTLEKYLRLAEQIAGPATWNRVRGFRFLLQAIFDKTAFTTLVSSESFILNLQVLGKRGYSFDVGVDQHFAGVWQLEAMTLAMQRAHQGISEDEKIAFVINHLCKPDFSGDKCDFDRWCAAISGMAKCTKTYMKLSGAFSELSPGFTFAKEIASHLKPWIQHVLQTFGPARVMFGSDWPVCNVKGPAGETSWSLWREVVEAILADPTYGLSEHDKDCIWYGTAAKAYQLGVGLAG